MTRTDQLFINAFREPNTTAPSPDAPIKEPVNAPTSPGARRPQELYITSVLKRQATKPITTLSAEALGLKGIAAPSPPAATSAHLAAVPLATPVAHRLESLAADEFTTPVQEIPATMPAIVLAPEYSAADLGLATHSMVIIDGMEPAGIAPPNTPDIALPSAPVTPVGFPPRTDHPSPPEAGPRPLPVAPPVVPGPQPANGFRLRSHDIERLTWPAICEREDGVHEQVVHLLPSLRQVMRSGNIVLMASHTSSEGRTTIGLMLAREAVRAGMRVALVDCHASRPQLAHRLGVHFDSVIPDEVMCLASLRDNMTVVPYLPLVSDQLTFGATRLLSDLAARHDLVVLDAGPIGEDGAALLGKLVSLQIYPRALVVRDVRRTTPQQLNDVLRELQRNGIVAFGVAENFAA